MKKKYKILLTLIVCFNLSSCTKSDENRVFYCEGNLKTQRTYNDKSSYHIPDSSKEDTEILQIKRIHSISPFWRYFIGSSKVEDVFTFKKGYFQDYSSKTKSKLSGVDGEIDNEVDNSTLVTPLHYVGIMSDIFMYEGRVIKLEKKIVTIDRLTGKIKYDLVVDDKRDKQEISLYVENFEGICKPYDTKI